MGFCGKRAAFRTLPSFYALESWNMRLIFFKTQFPLLFPAKRHACVGIYWENSKGAVQMINDTFDAWVMPKAVFSVKK